MLLAHDVLLAAPKTVRQTPVKSENERCYLRVQLTFAAQDRSLERRAHTGRSGGMKRDQTVLDGRMKDQVLQLGIISFC